MARVLEIGWYLTAAGLLGMTAYMTYQAATKPKWMPKWKPTRGWEITAIALCIVWIALTAALYLSGHFA